MTRLTLLSLLIPLALWAPPSHAAAPASRPDWEAWLAARTTRASAAPPQVRWSSSGTVPRTIRGLILEPAPGARPEARAALVAPEVAARMGLSRADLAAPEVRGTARRSAVRFPQTFHGLPVLGHELVVVVRQDGAVVSVQNDLIAFDAPPTAGTLSAAEAVRLARAALPGSLATPAALAGARAVIVPLGHQAIRAWSVPVVTQPLHAYTVYVRADTGAILWIRNRMIQ